MWLMLAKGMVWKAECWYPGYPADTSSVIRVINPALVISKKTHLKKNKSRERREYADVFIFVELFAFNSQSVISDQCSGHHKPFCWTTSQSVLQSHPWSSNRVSHTLLDEHGYFSSLGFLPTSLAESLVSCLSLLLLQLPLQGPDSPHVSKQNWRQYWMLVIEFILGS